MKAGAFQAWVLLYPWVIAPASALVAGAVTWALARRQRPGDGELVMHFMVVMALMAVLAGALLSTQAVQRRLDPGIALHEQLAALPVSVAMRESLPAEWERLQKEAAPLLARPGATSAEVRQWARVQYLPLARRLLPWADREAALDYAHAVLDVLGDLAARHPAQCVAFAWPAAPPPAQDALARVDEAKAHAYESAVAGLVARHRHSRTPSPQAAAAVAEGDINAMQRAYAAIRDDMAPRYAPGLMRALHTREVARFDPGEACAASIELLRRALETPEVAHRLTTNMLRS